MVALRVAGVLTLVAGGPAALAGTRADAAAVDKGDDVPVPSKDQRHDGIRVPALKRPPSEETPPRAPARSEDDAEDPYSADEEALDKAEDAYESSLDAPPGYETDDDSSADPYEDDGPDD